VPAVLISPWLPMGLGSELFGARAWFDHSSVVKALRSTFNLGDKLTDRDEASPDWNGQLLTRSRKIDLTLPRARSPRSKKVRPDLEEISSRGAPSGNLLGVSQIAVDVDWHAAERLGQPPLIASEFKERMQRAQMILMGDRDTPVSPAKMRIAHRSVLQYLSAVRARDAKLAALEGRTARSGNGKRKRASKRKKR
jgi:phospholipase C